MNIEDWQYHKELIFGIGHSDLAICTFWTDKEKVASLLNPNDYFVIGNLRSKHGINAMLRTLHAFDNIRFLLLLGDGRDGVLPELLELNKYPNLYYDWREKTLEGIGLPKEVKMVDMTDLDWRLELLPVVEDLGILPPRQAGSVLFKEEPIDNTKPLSSEIVGFRIEQDTVFHAWLELCGMIYQYGNIKPSDYSYPQRELLDVSIVITKEQNLDLAYNQDQLKMMGLTEQALQDYYPQILTSNKYPELAYTYGERLNIYHLTKILQEAWYSRRAIAITWRQEEDNTSDSPPCMISVQPIIQNDKLHLLVKFRSQDAFKAFPRNALALRKLQEQVANRLSTGMGYLSINVSSAHIYQQDWNVASQLEMPYAWKSDPRGYFSIVLTDRNLIAVQHYTIEGEKTGFYIEARSAKFISHWIEKNRLVSLTQHAAYLGAELANAEYALRYNLEYTQDNRKNV